MHTYLEEIMEARDLAIDTETAEGDIWCLSVSVRPGTAAVVMRDEDKVLSLLRDKVAQPGVRTICHNYLFDAPILAKVDIHPATPMCTMVMAYLLQDEPQGLKALAYRHLGMVMDDYSDMVDATTFRMACQYLIQLEEVLLAMPAPDPPPVLEFKKDGSPHVRQPQNILRKVKNILRDVDSKGADPFKRWHNIPAEERAIAEKDYFAMREAHLGDINRGDAVRYSARDADATIRLFPYLWGRIKALGLEDTFWRDMRAMPMVVDMMEYGMPAKRDHFVELSKYLSEQMLRVQAEIKVEVGIELNPGSPDQVRDLLFDKLKLKPYKRTGTGLPSTDEKVLARLVTDHPVVQMIRDWRSYETLLTSFANPMPNRIGPDGRVHTTLRMTRVETGRLSSSSPNLMAQPVRTAEGRKIRDGFEAPEDWWFLSGDYSQVEMRVAAHDSQDEEMLRIFREDLDIHSQTASRMFGIPEGALDEMLHRYPAKRVGFGILNDISAHGLQREMVVGGAKMADWPLARCKDLIQRWFEVFHGISAYMERSRAEARHRGYVRDMWGRFRRVPGVRSADKRTVADALRQAGNAPIQMGAQGIIKEAMGRLVEVYRDFHCVPQIQIHDDLVFLVRDDDMDSFAIVMKAVMEGVAPFLSVPLKVVMKYGRKWGNMEKWSLSR
jgi:DNA polymerase-1